MREQIQVMDQAAKRVCDREGKYLTFSLANEEYGIGILKVKEIIGMMKTTPVPPDAGIRQRRHQPPGKGYSGHRPPSAIRHGIH